jgi:hypothetical protein
VTHALNDDFVRQDPVKDKIGIGEHYDASKTALANPASRMRVRCDEFDDGMDAAFYASSAQRRMIIDIAKMS